MTSLSAQKNKNIVWEFWEKLNETKPDDLPSVVKTYVSKDISWHGPHPINDLNGDQAVITNFWKPLLKSFPNLQRRCDIFIGGHEHWVGAIGYFKGIFSQNWLDIPATGHETNIRFGEFSAVYEDKIVATYIILDVLDVMRQSGFQLVPPSRGEEGLVPGPMTGDGVLLLPHDDAEGAKSLALAKTMCAALNTTQLARFWDTDTMMWYGPSGIGTMRGIKGFEEKHQTPFNHAFPGYGATRMGVHVTEVGEGNYAGWVGWPSIHATQSGEYLGCPPTGRMVDWRLMDFYRREGDLIIENWVPVDMLNLFLTMGVDIYEKMRSEINKHQEK